MPQPLVELIIVLSQMNYFYVDKPQDLTDYTFGIGLIFKEICKTSSVVVCGLLTREQLSS